MPACSGIKLKCANFVPLEEWGFSQAELEKSLYLLLYLNPCLNTRLWAEMTAYQEGGAFYMGGLGKEVGRLDVS
jgi:hypothetical protein